MSLGRALPSQAPARLLWRDYLELTKPKVVLLMLLTSVVGMFLACRGPVPWDLFFWGNLGIGAVASGAAAMNHLADRHIDRIMLRTHNRPVAKGRVAEWKALLFALFLSTLGALVLWFKVNPLTTYLTLLSLVGYAGIYTLYLKRATPQNIVIGGLAGAMPPLLGWVAIKGYVDPAALSLVLIIFLWTPPHFWALAIHRRDDYAKVNVPMLPVTHGVELTRLHVWLYSILLWVASLLPYLLGQSGIFYLCGALALGFRFHQEAFRLYRNPEHHALKTFKFSITYLMILFLVLLIDHSLMLWRF